MSSYLPQRIQRFIKPELLSGVVVVGVMTMGVKGIAFLKEIVVAQRFGTSNEVDAYLLAMMIPAMVAMTVGNASRDAMVPSYMELRMRSESLATRLVSNTVWYCGILLVLAALVTLLFIDPLMDLLARGFPDEKRARSAKLLFLVMPYVVCVGVGNVLKGYLQAHSRFALSSIAPVLIPLSIIIVLLVMPGEPSGSWLALGTSAGALAMLTFLYVSTRKIQNGWLLQKPGWDDATGQVLRHAIPLLAGTVVLEAYFFVDTMMAAMLPAGSVAILTYGERICGVFCITGLAVAQALFPKVAELAAQKDWKQLSRMALGFSSLILAGSLPFVLLFWFASEPIIRIVFERGEFTAADTKEVAEVLRFAGFQVPGSILVALGARLVMALRANHFVLVTAICGLAVNVGLNLVFMRWFGVKGIALSTAIVNAFSAAMFYIYAGLRLRRLAAGAEVAN